MGTGYNFKQDIKTRQLVMMAFGGSIGVGFFIGTGETISGAGPVGAIIAYLLGAFILYAVILSLGEIGCYLPTSGSFGDYAHRFIGPFSGYYVYISYWVNCVLGNAIQYIGIGFLMQKWFPDSPLYLWILLSCALVFIINSYQVKIFAEIEYYLSFIKIIAIILFLIFGIYKIIDSLYFYHFSFEGLENVFSNFYINGVFPNGLFALFSAVVFISYAFAGSEVIGVAIGETKEPKKALPIAISAILWRMIVFFAGAVFIISVFLPYNDARITESPFVAVLEIWKIPYAPDLINAIIIIAIFSSSNTGIYGSARMLWGLSEKGYMPKSWSKINAKGVPMNSLILSTIISLIGLISIWVEPQKVISALIVIAGLSMMFVWMSVSISQYNFRKWYLKEGHQLENLPFRTPWTPYTQIFAVFGCAIPIIVSCIIGEYRDYVWYTFGLMAIIFVMFQITKRLNKTS
ncbi:amino acid permease [Helicobacter sp. 13S00477-4]|uniref:amino acid permease n=1 Tax=Helicobacter sp. 13S00477-4 TaxID=1905759 RepID=UPI000BA4E9EB|nr:amino acid permease [Helicobacter sp. 13S00477-4]PAF51929.1 hypothetical protein BKH44_04505 [Helicobacter sp. 13S00477-4]